MTDKIKQSLDESPLKTKFDSMMAEDSAFARCYSALFKVKFIHKSFVI